jgi:post-segregation antitoxin (ccd killing protein)
METMMTPDNKTVSVYLSEDLRKRADEAGINLSATLRDALETELDRQDTLAAAQDGMVQQNVDIDAQDGRALRLRFTGKRVAGGKVDVYLTDDGKVVFVFADDYDTFQNVDAFLKWALDKHRYNFGAGEKTIREAVTTLGGRTVIDL